MIVEIVFAAGCFWGVEKHFENIDGVIDVKSGYVGGNYPNPTYSDVLKYRHIKDNEEIVNYTEAVKVKFNNSNISANKLIKSFWELHDPTQKNRQGNDIGNNYRSAIFYTNENQYNQSINTKNQYQNLLNKNGYGKIATQIKPLKRFYDAESFHQNYLTKNPNGYCPTHSTGVKFIKNDKIIDLIYPLQGKEIIVIHSDNCPYCDKFKDEVTTSYKGTLSLRTVYPNQLKNFSIKTKLDATPTILFIEDGQEIVSHRGFTNEKDFYKMLGEFKLGYDSLSFKIAFKKGTEHSFCKQYDIFKNTPDGVFIDKVSGEILFDTKDRFISSSGWLSFYKAKRNATIQKEDNSYGMSRVEVIAKKSGIHLGHVFPKANGKKRFCINANVLEFIPREKVK